MAELQPPAKQWRVQIHLGNVVATFRTLQDKNVWENRVDHFVDCLGPSDFEALRLACLEFPHLQEHVDDMKSWFDSSGWKFADPDDGDPREDVKRFIIWAVGHDATLFPTTDSYESTRLANEGLSDSARIKQLLGRSPLELSPGAFDSHSECEEAELSDSSGTVTGQRIASGVAAARKPAIRNQHKPQADGNALACQQPLVKWIVASAASAPVEPSGPGNCSENESESESPWSFVDSATET